MILNEFLNRLFNKSVVHNTNACDLYISIVTIHGNGRIKGKPGFLVKYKLQTIFTWNFHEIQQTNNCLHGTFKNVGLPYKLLYDSYIGLMKNKHKFRGT